MIKTRFIGALVIILIALTGCGKANMPSAASNAPVVDDARTSYINQKLDPLVKSVTANIDTNWKLYLVDPIDRLGKDGDLDAFKSDAGLMVSLFEGIQAEVDSLDVPKSLSEDDSKNVAVMKAELKAAIEKRIEVANSLINLSKSKVLNTDIVAAVEESNKHLQAASQAYGIVVNK